MAVKKTKKLSELQTITTADGNKMIPVVDGSGNVNPIKLSDLAQVVAELMPVATAEKKGLMDRRFANRKITLQPSGTARVENDFYGLIGVREISLMGLNVLLSIQWNSIIEIHKSGNMKDKIVFSSTKTGALIITNNLDKEVTLNVRYLI